MNDLTAEWNQVTSGWSESHQRALASVAEKLGGNWITENVASESDEVEEMLRKAFRSGFYSGAGCSHKLREMGV
jgi:hypothetical protein